MSPLSLLGIEFACGTHRWPRGAARRRFPNLYDVEEERVTVLVVAVGKKTHNIVRIEGREFSL